MGINMQRILFLVTIIFASHLLPAQNIGIRLGCNYGYAYNTLKLAPSDPSFISPRKPMSYFIPSFDIYYKRNSAITLSTSITGTGVFYSYSYTHYPKNEKIITNISEGFGIPQVSTKISYEPKLPMFLGYSGFFNVYLKPRFSIGPALNINTDILKYDSSNNNVIGSIDTSIVGQKWYRLNSFGVALNNAIGLTFYRSSNKKELFNISLNCSKGFTPLAEVIGHYSTALGNKYSYAFIMRGTYWFLSLSTPITLYRFKHK